MARPLKCDNSRWWIGTYRERSRHRDSHGSEAQGVNDALERAESMVQRKRPSFEYLD
jgi:hypothetical protein